MSSAREGEPEFSIPDSIIGVVGFRRWVRLRKTERDTLRTHPHDLVSRKHKWPVNEMGALPLRAKCMNPWYEWRDPCENHLVPTSECDCGIYVHRDFYHGKQYRDHEGGRGSIFGAAIGWGRVYFDEKWWRAEFALPLCIAHPRETESHATEMWLEEASEWAEGVAERYKIPILPAKDIKEYAYQFGGDWDVPPLTDAEEEDRKGGGA